jgi:hypothetical protein
MKSKRYGLYVIIVLFLSCKKSKENKTLEDEETVLKDINKVMEVHTTELMSISGVVGVYIGLLDETEIPCIKVMVIKKNRDLEKKIPKSLEGHPVIIVESGEIKPFE